MKHRYDQLPHITFWRAQLAEALDYELPSGPSQLQLSIPEESRAWAKRAAREPKRVAISLSAMTPLKRYLSWSKVVRALRQLLPEFAILLVGMQGPDPALLEDGVYDWTQKTNLVELAALLQSAAVVVGTDGLVTNLAASLDIPTVALFSIIRPDFVIDPAKLRSLQVRAITTGDCPKQFCYPLLGNYRHALCPYEPHLPPESPPICMQFPPRAVVEAILSQLNGH